MYRGDVALGATIDLKFTTRSFTTGAPTTLAGTPVISAYVDNGTTEITAGITLSVDFDGRAGLHNVRVVATSGNGFAAGTNVDLVITTGTVGGVSVVGEVIGSFSIEARSAIRPATAGRTLVVDAAGLADANVVKVGPTGSGTAQTARDIGASVLLSNGTGTGQLKLASGYVAMTWADIAAPTTAQALTGTTIATTQKVDVETIKTNPVVNAGTITFPTGATLASTTNITGGVITTVTNLTNAPTAGDLTATMKTSVENAVWDATLASHLSAGSTGFALNAAGSAGDPWGTALPGAYGAGTAGHIIGTALPDIAPGAANGLLRAGTNAATSITTALTANLIGNVTGNLSGSVGSVTGAVGSVVAAVDITQGGADKVWLSASRTLTAFGFSVAVGTGGITAASFAAGAIDAAATAADFVTEIGTGVWATATRVLTAGTNIVLAKGVGVTGFTDLSQADVRTAVGMGSANLDTQLAAIAADAATSAAAAAFLDATVSSRATPAQVNTEVVDALAVDTYGEPTGVPAATTTLALKVGRLYQALRNEVTVDATDKRFKNDAGANLWRKPLADDGTTYTESEGQA